MKPKMTHMPAVYFIENTGIARRTFFTRVVERNVEFIQPYRSDKFYSVKDFLKKNPDYQIKED